MDNQKSKHDTFKQHPVNPKILDILIQTIIYPIHLENLSFAVEKTIGFNLDGVYIYFVATILMIKRSLQ
jgi:hypothetical protein